MYGWSASIYILITVCSQRRVIKHFCPVNSRTNLQKDDAFSPTYLRTRVRFSVI